MYIVLMTKNYNRYTRRDLRNAEIVNQQINTNMGYQTSKEEVVGARATGNIHMTTFQLQLATLSIIAFTVFCVLLYVIWRRCMKYYKKHAAIRFGLVEALEQAYQPRVTQCKDLHVRCKVHRQGCCLPHQPLLPSMICISLYYDSLSLWTQCA